MDFNLEIGQRIRAVRERLGMSLDQLGQTMDASASTISAIELGNRKVKAEELVTFGRTLQVSVNYLLGDVDVSAQTEPSTDVVLLRSTAYLHPMMKGQIADFFEHVKTLDAMHGRSTLAGETPTDILQKIGWNERPVDARYIAALAGIQVVSWSFDDDICGVLAMTMGRKAIGVNRNHPKYRQRFSIAHELGHYFLRHTDTVNVSLRDALISDVQSDPFQERQANDFAARLLMPQEWVREDYDQLNGSLSRLSEHYQVSEQAMWIRLKEIELLTDAFAVTLP